MYVWCLIFLLGDIYFRWYWENFFLEKSCNNHINEYILHTVSNYAVVRWVRSILFHTLRSSKDDVSGLCTFVIKHSTRIEENVCITGPGAQIAMLMGDFIVLLSTPPVARRCPPAATTTHLPGGGSPPWPAGLPGSSAVQLCQQSRGQSRVHVLAWLSAGWLSAPECLAVSRDILVGVAGRVCSTKGYVRAPHRDPWSLASENLVEYLCFFGVRECQWMSEWLLAAPYALASVLIWGLLPVGWIWWGPGRVKRGIGGRRCGKEGHLVRGNISFKNFNSYQCSYLFIYFGERK